MATKPKYDQELESALKMIEGIRSSQTGGIQALGTEQTSNISNVYNTLRGGLNEGASAIQGIYDRGGQNVRNAYGMGGAQSAAANMAGMDRISGNASRMGMDQSAISSVQSKLAEQAGLYDRRNAQSAAERSATMAQQGAGHSAIAQMAVQAAHQAEAQGKTDLSKRIMTEIAKANTTAAQGRLGATQDATNRSAKTAAEAQRDAESAMAELVREQKELAREERRAARENDPLDQAIKMLRLQQMEAGLDPDSPDNVMDNLRLEEMLYDRDDRNAETADDVWNDIKSRFPNQGKKTIPLLMDAIQAASMAKDESGITSRKHVQDNIGKLDLQVVLDQLARLERAGARKR